MNRGIAHPPSPPCFQPGDEQAARQRLVLEDSPSGPVSPGLGIEEPLLLIGSADVRSSSDCLVCCLLSPGPYRENIGYMQHPSRTSCTGVLLRGLSWKSWACEPHRHAGDHNRHLLELLTKLAQLDLAGSSTKSAIGHRTPHAFPLAFSASRILESQGLGEAFVGVSMTAKHHLIAINHLPGRPNHLVTYRFPWPSPPRRPQADPSTRASSSGKRGVGDISN